MNDLDAIRDVLAAYCFATDTGDTESWTSLFTEDVLWEGGAFGRFESKVGARDYHRAAGGESLNYRHFCTNPVIRLQGDAAKVCSYVQVYHTGGEAAALIFTGIYEDEFVKQNGHWLIKTRRLHGHPKDMTVPLNLS